MNDMIPFVPVSPSKYWKMRSWQYEAIAQRRGRPIEGLRIVFEHIKPNRDKIQVVVLVDRKQTLDTLVPLLNAAQELPAGFHFEAYVLESAPWDVITAPRSFQLENPDAGE